jgi:UDP-N-acetylmuramoyl-tripeptide--D-alanyl-D-alanine ligase
MIRFAMSEISDRLNARHLGADVSFDAVSTDTRRINPGQLFVALKGPNFDGHDYLDKALAQGAAGAMVSRDTAINMPRLLVHDTRIGLGRLAAMWRESSAVPVVAITGSNGKTTVKEMVAAILSTQGKVLATQGNLNNDIGLPLTLLRLQEHDFAVVEMGANHVGEIDYLSRIAQPDCVLINNAGRAHLEGFGSVEQVARAKGEIINGLKADGCIIYNGDDPMSGIWRELSAGKKSLRFGTSPSADVRLLSDSSEFCWNDQGFVNRFVIATPMGEIAISMSLAGYHNQLNAAAATAVSLQLGATAEQIQQGLASISPVAGRLQFRQARQGVSLVDDSYNANPESVSAAIAVLAAAPGQRFLVLGPLAELGEGEADFYRELGNAARCQQVTRLYAVGNAGLAAEAFGRGGRVFRDNAELIAALQGELGAGDAVLVKGSRSAGMEQVVNALINGEGV